jgi:type I restriction enzyme R subunit
VTVNHNEDAFEAAIEHSLLSAGGYRIGDPADFAAALGLTPSLVIDFLRDSQPREWARLEAMHGATTATKVVGLIAKELDNRGTLDVLRHGVVDHGVKLRLAFFKPATTLNPEAQAL